MLNHQKKNQNLLIKLLLLAYLMIGKSGEFTLNNKNYKLLFDYTTLKDDGWSFNLADYGYSNGYIMNKGDKVTGTIHVKNPNFDSDVTIGIMNNSDIPKDMYTM